MKYVLDLHRYGKRDAIGLLTVQIRIAERDRRIECNRYGVSVLIGFAFVSAADLSKIETSSQVKRVYSTVKTEES